MPEDRTADSTTRSATDRRTLLKGVGAAGVAGLGGLAGCAGGGGGGTVRYGVLTPDTGTYSSLAEGQRQGARMAIRDVNESDEYDFEIERFNGDTEASDEVAQSEAERLIRQNDIDYMMGAISSSVALSLNEVADSQEIVYNPGGAAIPITGGACNEYVFRCETNTAMIAEACAEWTVENLGSDVFFHIANYAYGESVLREWRSRMEASDAEFNEVDQTGAEFGAENFDPFISQIANSDADVAVIGATGGDLVRFLSQAASQNLQDEVDIMTTTGSFLSVRRGIGEAGYGVYSGTRYVPSVDTGDNQDFVGRYRDQYDSEPDNFARVAYDSVRMTANGIREAGTADPEEVKDTLAGLSQSPTLFGDNAFRSCDHQATNPVWVGRNVEPEGDTAAADVELVDRVAGSDAIPSCSDVDCDLG
jgi:branched-chain amino acid transport system substrate-binding protein